MALLIFAVILVVLSALGFFSTGKRQINYTLTVHMASVKENIEKKGDELEFKYLQMSEELTKTVGGFLRKNNTALEKTKNNYDMLSALEEEMMPVIANTLKNTGCSGAFAVLDTTVNTNPNREGLNSAGIYLRKRNRGISEANADMILFRGISSLADKGNIDLYDSWDMEMRCDLLPGYEDIIGTTSKNINEEYYWTEKVTLRDTWESVMLLCVPIVDDNSRIIGICGAEISELFLKAVFPFQNSAYGDITVVFCPFEEGKALLGDGLIGETSTHLTHDGVLEEKGGRYFNSYTIGEDSYIGIRQPIKFPLRNGNVLNAVSLIDFRSVKAVSGNTTFKYTVLSCALLVLAVVLSLYLSKRFSDPILKKISDVKNSLNEGSTSGISEIEELISFLQKSEKNRAPKGEISIYIEGMIDGFMKKYETLTPTEKIIFNYLGEGKSNEEISSHTYTSVATIKRHCHNIYTKLDIPGKDSLAVYVELLKKCGRYNEIISK